MAILAERTSQARRSVFLVPAAELPVSVFRFVDQSPFRNPRHHIPKPFSHRLDIVLGGAPAHCFETRPARGVLEHPFLGEPSRLNIIENLAHARLYTRVNDARTTGIVTIFGSISNRVPHVGDAALVNEVDNELDLVETLEIGHFRCVTGLDQGLVSGKNERRETTAQYRLFAE